MSVALAGCQPGDQPQTPVATEVPVLTGKPAPKLVGKWEVTTGNKSTMNLSADGQSSIMNEVKTPGGVMKSDVSGKWSEDSGKLMMQRVGPDKKEFVVSYDYTLDASGSTLTLARSGSKTRQVFHKAK